MNWYAMLLFLIASPIGWVAIIGLTGAFIYAGWRFEKAMKQHEYFKRQHDANAAQLAGSRPQDRVVPHPTLPIHVYEPATTEVPVGVQHVGMKLHPWYVTPEFWFGIQMLAGVLLIVMLGLPMLCTFVTNACP